MIDRKSWWWVAFHPDRWDEAILYFWRKRKKNKLAAFDNPDPRDVSVKLATNRPASELPRAKSLRKNAINLNWTPIIQSRNSCTAYAKAYRVEIVNTIEHQKPIYIDAEELWKKQESTGGSRDSGDYIQNAEKQFHKSPQGFPQMEYRRMRRNEDTVEKAKMWIALGVPIASGCYWKWDKEEKETNSSIMKKTGFFTTGSGEVLGGHAISIVGYDDDVVAPDGERGAFEVLESELMSWGKNPAGVFWIKYSDWKNIFSKHIARDAKDFIF